jgi:hypothetical protein
MCLKRPSDHIKTKQNKTKLERHMQNAFVFLEAHMQNEKENERKQSWELNDF